MDKVRIGFIGCGGRAGAHFQKLVTFEDVELVGFADIIPARAENFMNRAGTGKVYTCYKQMLDETKPDAVVIAVPPHCHGEIEYDVINRGIHFIIEKPMALDIKVAEQINEAITAKNLITSVGFQDRYQDITAKIVELMKGKKVGIVDGAWVGGIPGVWWWRKMETSGGQIVEQNIHIFDMVRYLFGEPTSVYCAADKGIVLPAERGVPGYNVDDYSSAIIKFESGLVCTIFTGCYVKHGFKPSGLNIYCEDCAIEYYLRNKVIYRHGDQVEEFQHIVDGNKEQTWTLDRVFVDALKTGDTTKILSPYSDALKSLRLCLACNDSIKTGKAIQL